MTDYKFTEETLALAKRLKAEVTSKNSLAGLLDGTSSVASSWLEGREAGDNYKEIVASDGSGKVRTTIQIS